MFTLSVSFVVLCFLCATSENDSQVRGVFLCERHFLSRKPLSQRLLLSFGSSCICLVCSDNGVCTKPIVLTEDDGYALDEFLLPKMYYKYLDKVLIPQGMVRDRVERMVGVTDKTASDERFSI